MKKFMMSLMAIVVVFSLNACNTDGAEKMCALWTDGQCMTWTDGQDGQDGIDGQDGLSAYELAVVGGFIGTEEEWIISLQGVNGIDGIDGLSAYELAVLGGFEGTLEEWLISLIGATGDTGADGVCPDCNITEPPTIDNVCPPKLDVNDTRVHFIYYHNRMDLEQYSMQYFTNTSSIPQLMKSVGIEVGEKLEGLSISEVNGTTVIRGVVKLFEDANEHGIGITFEKFEPVIIPVED